jgi:hypothetical protein
MATNLVCRDGVASRLIFIPVYAYISRVDFLNFGVSYKCMIHGMVRSYVVLRTLIYLLMWRVEYVTGINHEKIETIMI